MRARVLPVEEWPRLENEKLPSLGVALLPREVDIVVVEDEGRIVARMMVMRVTHLEGAWIDPEYRNAGVVGALLRETASSIGRLSDRWVMAGSADPSMDEILTRMGGVEWPGRFYILKGMEG